MICFIILHYNTIEETEKCIASIEALEEKEAVKIVIVDNASPDGSGAVLKKKYEESEQITVLLRKKNDGFSAGNNEGCAYAVERWNPDFIVAANNDIEFKQKSFISYIQNEYQRSRFAVLGPDIYNPILKIHQSPIGKLPPDRKRINRTIFLNQMMLRIYPAAYPFLKKWFRRMEHSVDATDYQIQQKDVCLMGACLIYSRDYIESRNKIFEPETKFYYEENIQAVWCLHHNMRMVYQPSMQVWHMDGRATKSVDKNEKRRIRFRMENILQAAIIYKNFLMEIENEKETGSN